MIVVYGATGLSGGLIAAELAARGADITLAGRDRGRLERAAAAIEPRPPIRVAAAHRHTDLVAAFRDADVVVSCAGPFHRLGERILSAAIEAGAHILDISSEQAFMRSAYENYEGAAHRAGVVCVSGMAFESALGDWAAALAHQRLRDPLTGGPRPADETIDSLTVAYAIRRAHVSPATRASAVRSLASPCAVWKHDRWELTSPGGERRRFGFGGPFGDREAVLFPGGEAITIPRHLACRTVKTFMFIETRNPLLWETTRLAPWLAPVLGPLVAGPLGDFVRAQVEATGAPPTADERRDTEFAILAIAEDGFNRARVAVRGRDPYQLTGEICSAGALALASRGGENGGVLAPAEVFDARARLHSLAARELIDVEES